MKLFIGLGNPGGEYRHHRHNVGFMAVDEIHAQYSFSPWRSRFQGLVAEGQLGGQKCLLLKPATHMNESGRSVGEAVRFFKLETEDVTVFHDELDLAPGKLRVKTGGGHAGHNGLRSLDSHIGPEYQRVRIGIGHPGRKDLVHRYVLHNFAKSDLDWLVDMLDEIARAVEYLATGDAARFQNEVARHLRPDDKSKQQAAGNNKPTPDNAKNKAKPHKWQMVSDTAQSLDVDITSVASDKKDDGSLAAKLRKWMKKN